MAITVQKFIKVGQHPFENRDKRIAQFLVTDGIQVKIMTFSNLSDDTDQAKAEIEGREDIEQKFSEADPFQVSATNIDSVDSVIRGKNYGQLKASAQSANSVPNLRQIVFELVEIVEALKDRLDAN